MVNLVTFSFHCQTCWFFIYLFFVAVVNTVIVFPKVNPSSSKHHSGLWQAAWVAGQYAHINFADQNNFRKALHSVVSGMRDPELPVRVDSVFALRSFVEACKGVYSQFYI